MGPRKKISPRQIDILLDFVEQNPDIAMGRHPPGPGYLGVQRAREMWDSLATTLNSVAEGVTKTGEQWKRYWIEYKARIKVKAADSRRSHNKTGGGPSQLSPLDPQEERVLALIGIVAVEGLPDVRIPVNLEEPDPIMMPVEPVVEHGDPQPRQPPEIVFIEELADGSAPPVENPPPRSRLQRLRSRPINNIPSWAFDLEQRQLAGQERLIGVVERGLEAVVTELQMLFAAVTKFLDRS